MDSQPFDNTPPRSKGLFDKALSGEKPLPTVAETVTSGKRWEYTHTDVEGTVMIIYGFEPVSTQYGEAYVADAELWGENHKVLIGGVVLMSQLAEMKDKLPMVVKTIRPGKAYTFTDPEPEELADYATQYLT